MFFYTYLSYQKDAMYMMFALVSYHVGIFGLQLLVLVRSVTRINSEDRRSAMSTVRKV